MSTNGLLQRKTKEEKGVRHSSLLARSVGNEEMKNFCVLNGEPAFHWGCKGERAVEEK